MITIYNEPKDDEILIKMDEEDFICLILSREPRFDKDTAKLFISVYKEQTDYLADYPYSVFLNNAMILTSDEVLKFFEYDDFENFWDDKLKDGWEYSVDEIRSGKNKGKYLVIEGAM